MNLEPYIAVSGLPGIYKLAKTRNNGLLISDLDTGITKFVSVRSHQFTPLGTVAIYTYQDATELKVIYRTMLEKLETLPPPSIKESNNVLSAYFREIMPDYDEDRVHMGDIKKVIKWFGFLHDRKLLTLDAEEEE